MSEEPFRLQLETHSETRLLQTLQLGPQHAVQLVELFDKYYLLERFKSERRQPLQVEDPLLIQRLAKGERLSVADLEDLLPPHQSIDVLLGDDEDGPASPSADDLLQARLRTAMARFMEQNPATARVLKQSETAAPEREPFEESKEPNPSIERAELEPLEQLTSPLVYEALRRAGQNQEREMERLEGLSQELERHTQQVTVALDRLPALQERLDALRQRLEAWQSQMEMHHVARDSLLERTAAELSQLQVQLQEILSQGLALQKIMRERRFQEHEEIAVRLDCLEDMLEHVLQQRHWVNYLQQQNAFRELEQARLQKLTQRRQELQAQIQVLKSSIEKIEQVNRDILEQNPLAVPEPVPALALHELLRLEHEIQILEADPALKLLEANL